MRKGYRYELEFKKLLKKNGFFVSRITGSGHEKSGDLIAIKDKTYLFEIKSTHKNKFYTRPHAKDQFAEMQKMGEKRNLVPLLAVRFVGGRESIMKKWKICKNLGKKKYSSKDGIYIKDFLKLVDGGGE